MIEEAYVSFETAKLLKEKGFDEPCVWAYDPNGASFAKSYSEPKNSELNEYEYSKPTQQMAMRWLREVYKIFIEVYVDKAYNSKDIIFNTEIWNENLNSVWRTGCLTTYEQACEAAVKYCLENLI